MAKFSKKAVTRMTILVFVMAAISLTLFSCSTYCAQNQKTYIDMENVTLIQLEEPSSEDTCAVIHTTAGDITAVLYTEESPQYTEQFIRLANEGYYDGTYVFQVEKDVYFSAGSPDKTGSVSATQAASAEENVVMEKSQNLWPFRGALCAPKTGHDRNFWDNLFGQAADYVGTRFLVCDTIEFDEATLTELQEADASAKAISDVFIEKGGIPNYAQQMTVFGQAYGDESFDTIDTITAAALAEADENSGYTAPAEDIVIESIDIAKWSEISAEK